MADIPASILESLNSGSEEAVTLVEGLAIDFGRLVRAALPDAGQQVFQRTQEARALGYSERMRRMGAILYDRFGVGVLERLACHRSDTVRSWGASLIAAHAAWSLEERLERLKCLADDSNPGVREWAWLAVRPMVAAKLTEALALLQPWTSERSENHRRFASEVTRPRGVWCAHLDELKRNPHLASPLLDPLCADASRYVQLSVGNWLNDAGKSRPDWVQATCARWLQESPCPATEWITRHGTRSFRKARKNPRTDERGVRASSTKKRVRGT